MSCEHCTDENGEACYPMYGVGPHRHEGDGMLGSTVILPRDEWPSNYWEDPECPGLGVWTCPYCSSAEPAPAESQGTG